MENLPGTVHTLSSLDAQPVLSELPMLTVLIFFDGLIKMPCGSLPTRFKSVAYSSKYLLPS